MSKWKDVSSYSQGDKNRIPHSWQLKAGNDLTLGLHRHIHYAPDVWLITCEPFFSCMALKTTVDATAKDDAVTILRKRLKDAIEALEQP